MGLYVELCREALTHVSRDENRQLYAELKLYLGDALMISPVGRHASNIEDAISAYQGAIEACATDDLTMLRAAALNQLANAYGDRIFGNQLENAERELGILRDLQRTLPRGREPAAWATVTMNIANALGAWPGVDRADRMEESFELYGQVLHLRTKDAVPQEWAQATYNLATWYQKRIRGDRRVNLETALRLHYDGLTVRTREAYPLEWSRVTMAVGNVCAALSGLLGDEDYAVKAIEAYDSALSVLTREKHPRQWADVILNMASMYREKATGDQTVNAKKAIELYTSALDVLEQPSESWANAIISRASIYLDSSLRFSGAIERAIEDFGHILQVIPKEAAPLLWGRAARGLANSYRSQRTVNYAGNLERAIALLVEVVDVYGADPEERAGALQDLAQMYSSRQIGGRAQNEEYAIVALVTARSSLHRENAPLLWASVTTSLANAHIERIVGDRRSNANIAIRLYEEALEVRTFGRDESEWASTALGLASAYALRRADGGDIEHAIELYSRVISVRAAEERWEEWAKANHGLGIAFSVREAGMRVDNAEKAIAAYERALTVKSLQDADPVQWTHILVNVADLYGKRELGNSAENLSRRLNLLEAAMSRLRSGPFPAHERLAARNLGDAYVDAGRWHDATGAYDVALDATERLYESSLVGSSKTAELAANGDLYRVAAYALARNGKLEEAAVTFERGRARALAETQVEDSAVLRHLEESDPDIYGRYAQAARNVQQLAYENEMIDPFESFTSGHFRKDTDAAMTDARRRLEEVIEEIRNLVGYETFLERVTFSVVSSGSAPDVPLVYLTSTDWGSLALVVRPSGPFQIHAVFAELFTSQDIDRLFRDSQGLLAAHDLGTPEAIDSALSAALPILGERLIAPLATHLRSIGVLRVTIVPGGPLAILPLHAAPYELDGASICLIDEFDVAYAPSARSIRASRVTVGHLQDERCTLFGLANPLPHPCPLTSAEAELEQIGGFFRDQARNIFSGHNATKGVLASLPGSRYAHFSCHGFFDILDPLSSGLELAGGETWSAREILASSAFKQTRLAVLSACQTAMVDFVRSADEVIGLSTSMLQAGAAGVVGTLWVVDDLSTSLLMVKFYSYHLQGDPASGEPPMNPARALTQAQRWLRDLTIGDLQVYLEEHRALRDVALSSLAHLSFRPTSRPFSRPYSWAPFILTGA